MEQHPDGPDNQLTQMYFWGGHGGVGGGDIRQQDASNCTIRFCIEEMARRGIALAIDMDKVPEYGNVEIEVPEIRSSRIMGLVENFTGKYVRPIPSIDLVHPLAIKRYQRVSDWRPDSLRDLEEELLAYELSEEFA